MTRIRLNNSFLTGHRVLRSRISFRQGHLAVDFHLIAPQNGKLVSLTLKLGEFRLALGCRLKDSFGFGEALKELVGAGQINIPERNIGIERDRSPGLLDRSFHICRRRDKCRPTKVREAYSRG